MHRIKLFTSALCTGAVCLLCGTPGAEEIRLGINPAFDARGQGFEWNGFEQEEVVPDRATLRLRLPAAPPKQPARLRTCFDMLAGVDIRDMAAVEVRFRAAARKKAPPEPVNACFRLRLASGESREQKFPLVMDGNFHTCRIELDSLGASSGKTTGSYCCLYPDPEGKLAGGEIEFECFRLILSPAGELRNYTRTAELRFELLADQFAGLRKFQMEPRNAAREFDLLRQKSAAIASGKQTVPEKIAEFRKLSGEYAALNQKLSGGRRLVNLALECASLKQTLRFRQEKQPPVPRELHNALRQLENDCGERSEQFRRDSAVPSRELDALETRCRTLWETLLEPAANGLCWQSGASLESFGLFGWSPGNLDLLAGTASRERIARSYFSNPDGSRSMLEIRPENAEFAGMAPEPSDINWVSRSWQYFYRTPEGKKIRWELAASWLAPGILIDTDAPGATVSLAPGREYPPLRLAVPTRNGVRLLHPDELSGFRWSEMSENWLLLLGGTPNPEVPWLLTLAHRPSAVGVTGGKMTLSRPAGLGTVGIASLYGVRPLPAGWSKNWTRLPAEVAAQCRRLNAVMTAYPWQCEEFFAVDRENARVRIANRFQYRKIENDWNDPGTETAPLPPALVLAVREGYPAELPDSRREPGFDTIYGPYAVCDSNRLEYSILLPDLRGESFLKTERDPKRVREANATVWNYKEMHYNTFAARPHYPAVAWAAVLDSWSLLEPAERKFTEENVRLNFDRCVAAFREANNTLGGIYVTHLPAERTEPFTGLPYSAFGWISRSGNRFFWHDITDFSGFILYGAMLYARYTGDWEEIRRNWSFLQEIYRPLLRRCDWASMAPGTTDNSLTHVIDMAPDSWIASEAMNRMAVRMENRRTADLAAMLAAKEAVPLVGSFLKREWDAGFNNTWDRNSQIPELGYSQYGGVQSTRWDNPILSTSMFVGMHFSPALLNLYRATCPKALARFADRMNKCYPQWKNPLFLRKGDKLSLNGPLAFARYIFLYDILNAPTEELEELAAIGALEKGGSLWKTTSGKSRFLLSNSATALLVGRDAPVRLREWGPARLERAVYDEKSGTAEIVFFSAVPFSADLTSFAAPVRVRANGADVSGDRMRYDSNRRQLSLQLDPGVTRLELDYPGWKMPERARIVSDGEDRPRASRDISAGNIPNDADSESVPLSLEKYFNAALMPGETGRLSPWSSEKKPATAEEKFLGIPFRVGMTKDGPAAVGIGGRFPRKAAEIEIAGSWKKLYFLLAVAGESGGTEKPLRYTVHYADGSRREFLPQAVPENTPRNRFGGKFPNRQFRLAVWENGEREEVAGVVADFQRRMKEIRKIDIESAAPTGSTALIAITGEEEENR